MFVSTGCSVFLAIGQLVSQNRLEKNLAVVVLPGLVEKIVSAGATNFRSVIPTSPVDLTAVIQAYGKSRTQVFVTISGMILLG